MLAYTPQPRESSGRSSGTAASFCARDESFLSMPASASVGLELDGSWREPSNLRLPPYSPPVASPIVRFCSASISPSRRSARSRISRAQRTPPSCAGSAGPWPRPAARPAEWSRLSPRLSQAAARAARKALRREGATKLERHELLALETWAGDEDSKTQGPPRKSAGLLFWGGACQAKGVVSARTKHGVSRGLDG